MATIDLSDAEAWFGKFETQLKRAAYLGLVSAALRGVQTIQTKIIPTRSPQPIDRAIYRAGWHAVPEEDGVVIENTTPHASFIEYGVRAANVKPGTKMIRALAEWVVRKGIASAAEADRAAWAIAKSMQKRGIFNGGQGFGILKEYIDKYLRDQVVEEVGREIARVVKQL